MIPTSKRFENKAWGAEWCTCPIQENIVGLSPNIAALTVRLVVGIHRTRSYSFKFFFKSGCVCEVISPDDDADVDDGYSTSKLYSNIFAASAQELSRTITINAYTWVLEVEEVNQEKERKIIKLSAYSCNAWFAPCPKNGGMAWDASPAVTANAPVLLLLSFPSLPPPLPRKTSRTQPFHENGLCK